MLDDDLIQVFRKTEDLESLARRLGKVGSPGGRFDVFQICNDGSMPTSTPAWFDAHPIAISGTESEGTTPTITYNPGQTIPVLVLGGVPSVGDNLPARLINGLWVAEKRGGPTGITACGCSGMPATLNGTYYYQNASGLPGVGCSGATFGIGSVATILRHSSATIAFGSGAVSGYWISDCFYMPDNTSCLCYVAGSSTPTSCYARVVLTCGNTAGTFREAVLFKNTSADCAAINVATDFGGLSVGPDVAPVSCSPFSWHDWSGIPNSNTLTATA